MLLFVPVRINFLLPLQGSEDKVMPPNQAEGIVETIRKQGGRVDYVVLRPRGPRLAEVGEPADAGAGEGICVL